MKSPKLVYLSALFVCCSALAQEPKTDAGKSDPAQVAMADYYDCTKRYAEKYSKSREPAQDIADAALSYCENARERLRSMLIDKLSAGGRSAREQVNNLFPGIIEKARLLGIRVVVESRYEASLSAGGAQGGIAPVLPGASCPACFAARHGRLRSILFPAANRRHCAGFSAGSHGERRTARVARYNGRAPALFRPSARPSTETSRLTGCDLV